MTLPPQEEGESPMKPTSFRAQSLSFFLLLSIPALILSNQRPGDWRLVGAGDYCRPRCWRATRVPIACRRTLRCRALPGLPTVCWSGNCIYGNVKTGSCTEEANPDRCLPARPRQVRFTSATVPLTARIDPAESVVESGGKVHLETLVSGGVPPYSYEWRNARALRKPPTITSSIQISIGWATATSS